MVAVVTTLGTKKMLTAMTIRMMSPQTDRPVAISAGLRRSTVSVKLAIHGANAIANETAMQESRTTNVAYEVLGCAARTANSEVKMIAHTAPTTMKGLRTLTLSETTPTISRPAASKAQNQSPSVLARDWVYPNTVSKNTGKNPTAT